MSIAGDYDILGTAVTVTVEPLNDDLCGDTSAGDRLIRINTKLRGDTQVETFYHELTHFILEHTGVAAILTDEQNEAVAQGLGMALSYTVSKNVLPRVLTPSEEAKALYAEGATNE